MGFELSTEVKSNDVVIVVVPSASYKKKELEVVKYLADKHSNVCYVNITHPFEILHSNLLENNISCDNFLFIDTISHKKKGVEDEQCIYIESPNALTSLSVSIKKVLKTNFFSLLIFDSLSSLLIYNKLEVVTRFTHDLLEGIRKKKILAIFVVKEGTDENLMADISMFADHTIKIK